MALIPYRQPTLIGFTINDACTTKKKQFNSPNY